MKNSELKQKDRLYIDVDFQIDKIKSKKNRYVITYRFSQILVFVLGAVITIIAGWSNANNLPFDSKNGILIISSSVTVMVAIQGLFDLKDKAWSYDILTYELRKLRSRMAFDFHKDPEQYKKSYEEYFVEFQRILESQKGIIENSYSSGE